MMTESFFAQNNYIKLTEKSRLFSKERSKHCLSNLVQESKSGKACKLNLQTSKHSDISEFRWD